MAVHAGTVLGKLLHHFWHKHRKTTASDMVRHFVRQLTEVASGGTCWFLMDGIVHSGSAMQDCAVSSGVVTRALSGGG